MQTMASAAWPTSKMLRFLPSVTFFTFSAMHELSLAESILSIIEDEKQTRSFDRVRAIRLEIGQLAAVEVDALRFCFDVVLAGSVAEGAQLTIDVVPGQGRCPACLRTVTIAERFDPCPECGGIPVEPTGGDRMRIRDLLVD